MPIVYYGTIFCRPLCPFVFVAFSLSMQFSAEIATKVFLLRASPCCVFSCVGVDGISRLIPHERGDVFSVYLVATATAREINGGRHDKKQTCDKRM